MSGLVSKHSLQQLGIKHRVTLCFSDQQVQCASQGLRQLGENPAAIRREILSGATEADAAAHVVEIGDRREAIDHAVAWADAGDVVLIAGKGHETGQTRAGRTQPFDDRVELAAALEGRRR